MKRVSMKIALAALLIAVGTLGLHAQIGQGGTCLGTGTATCVTGTCTYLNQMTAEQIAILDELAAEFQAEMDILSAELQATTSKAAKAAIRAEMTALRVAHLAEVQDLLELRGVI